MKQSLIKSVTNFRSYDGYQTRLGRIKDHTIFRGGDLSTLDDEEMIRVYDEFGISQIIDLRTTSEISQAQDKYVDGVRYQHFNVMGDAGEATANPSELLDELFQRDSFEAMKQLYRMFPTHSMPQNAYYNFFQEVLKDTGKGIYFHCAAGKDRTGYGGYLLLKLLGAEDEMIMDDYLLSNRYRAQEMEYELQKQLQLHPSVDPEQIRADIENTFGVKSIFLENSHEALLNEYGSFDAYVSSVLKLSDKDVESIRSRFLY